MYFAALTDGLADIPDPGPDARAEARRLLAEQGPAALHASLAHVDPATAARLKPEDSQRIARAWEVWRGTGRGLAAWQSRRSEPAPWRFSAIRLDPPRDDLRAAIAMPLSRRCCGTARCRRCRRLLALEPRSKPAGDARARGAGTVSPSCRRSVPAGSRTPDGTRHRSVHKAASDMVSSPRPCSPDPRILRLMRDFASMAQFSESERDNLFTFIENGG